MINFKELVLKTSLILGVVSCLTGLWLEVALGSVLVEPGRVSLSCKPGSRTTGTIKVSNPGDKETEVRAVIYDWTLDQADQIITTELGTRVDSLKGLIKFNPQHFKLAPGMSQTVRFTIVVPPGLSTGERRGIIFFEETNPTINQTGTKVITQVGTTIYLGVSPVKMALKMVEARVEMTKNHVSLGVVKLKNEGLGHIRYLISYHVITKTGSVVIDGETEELVVLPDFERETRFKIADQLESGEYTLQITVKFQGTNKTLVSSIPFTQVKM